MTEKEKMAAGLLYDANYDRELMEARTRCKDICHEFNSLYPSEEEKQKGLLKGLLGKTGEEFRVTAPFWCDYGFNIELGENFYVNHSCVILDCAKVTFGDNVFVGPDCGFYTAGHPIDAKQRNQGLEYARPIHVGDNVWIGGGIRVLPGVSIGEGAVIGSGSVVTKDIPPRVIAAGNPCRVIREIEEESEPDREKL